MSLRINSDTERVITQRNLQRADATVARAAERLSSGLRIGRAADDASGLTISERMRGQIRGLAQNQRNIGDGIALVQTADATLSGVHSMLQRMRELAVQYKSGSYSAADAAAIQSEVGQIAAEIAGTAQRAAFNGISLLTAAGTITFQVGAGDGETISASTISLGAVLPAGYATLGAASDLAEIDAAIDAVTAQRSSLGAVQNRLEAALDNASLTQVNTLASESRIRDADVALEAVAMARSRILSQSGMAMLAQANQASQGVLQLMR